MAALRDVNVATVCTWKVGSTCSMPRDPNRRHHRHRTFAAVDFVLMIDTTHNPECIIIKMELRNGLMFVNDIENEVANNAFDVALKYLQRNTDLDIQPDVTRVMGNSTDAREFLDQLCKVYNDSLEEKKAPHVVIDTTIAGVPSEVVKAFTSALGLPTLSASHGQDGDLRNSHPLPSFILRMMFKESSPKDGSFPSHTFITVLVLGQHHQELHDSIKL
uniref:Uncharacterized protein n=1 Tax=Timema monikensis TaxID=170555 RepID=A0A7R9EIC7_9NEOP|nr:unnamed protein product [Timema monikensis]